MLFGDSNIFEILGVIDFCPRRQDGRIDYNEFVEMMQRGNMADAGGKKGRLVCREASV